MLFRYRDAPTCTFADMRAIRPIPLDVLEAGRAQLLEHGYIEAGADDAMVLTTAGLAVADRLRAVARERLVRLLDGWSPEQYDDLQKLLTRLADDIAQAPPEQVRDGRAPEPVGQRS